MPFKHIARLFAGLVAAMLAVLATVTPAAATPNPHPPHFSAQGADCSTVVFAGGWVPSDDTIEVVRGPGKGKQWTIPSGVEWQFAVTGLRPGIYSFKIGDLARTTVVTSCKRGLAIDVWLKPLCQEGKQGILVANIGRRSIRLLGVEASRGDGLELVRHRQLKPGKLVLLKVPPVTDEPVGFGVAAWFDPEGNGPMVYRSLLIQPLKC